MISFNFECEENKITIKFNFDKNNLQDLSDLNNILCFAIACPQPNSKIHTEIAAACAYFNEFKNYLEAYEQRIAAIGNNENI